MLDLSNIPAFDVVIGLAFVYFLLSLVISSVTEIVSSLLQARWKTLQHGLRELFEDGTTQGAELWQAFQDNPRIRALWKETGRLGTRGPSYIPPRVFALTLLDTLAPPGGAASAAAGDGTDVTGDAVARADQMVADHDLLTRAKRAAGSVQNPLLQKWFIDALTNVGDERDDILRSLESSFDSVTNRVSGWYKRYATIWVAVFSILAAGALNVDSYTIGSRLWKDEAVRTTVAAQAGKLTDATCPSAKQTSDKSRLERTTECVTDLKSLGLPIGWAEENRPHSTAGWFAKAFGIVVTVFALMLGAPFWFDTLSKLARLRTTGKPEGTAKGDTGKPKD